MIHNISNRKSSWGNQEALQDGDFKASSDKKPIGVDYLSLIGETKEAIFERSFKFNTYSKPYNIYKEITDHECAKKRKKKGRQMIFFSLTEAGSHNLPQLVLGEDIYTFCWIQSQGFD